jgi:hypothetical protein
MNKFLENRLAKAGVFSFLNIQDTLQMEKSTEKPTEKPIVSFQKLNIKTETKGDTTIFKIR